MLLVVWYHTVKSKVWDVYSRAEQGYTLFSAVVNQLGAVFSAHMPATPTCFQPPLLLGVGFKVFARALAAVDTL